jgi:NAD(P)-dependent dehydrogenase (short-subunit alcohol dehydrogenase family)
MLLAGKVAVVTGAASARGIGRAAARRFAAEGAKVTIVDLEENAAREAAKDLGPEHLGQGCDVRSEEQCRAFAERAIDRFGQVDILANVAGISHSARLMECRMEDYDLVMDASVRGTFNMSRAFVPHFRSRRTGSIICFGSVAGLRGGGVFGGPHYSAAKGGVHSLAKAMARELAPDGIRVNAIAPGLVDTDIFAGALTDEKRREVIRNVPLGRIAQPDEIAAVCLFLASDLSTYVTGAIIDVNGGLHIH